MEAISVWMPLLESIVTKYGNEYVEIQMQALKLMLDKTIEDRGMEIVDNQWSVEVRRNRPDGFVLTNKYNSFEEPIIILAGEAQCREKK